MINRLIHDDELFAIHVSHSYNQFGINFFTDDDLSQQLAYMRHSEGKIISPHVHNPVRREVHYTQEVLIIKKGRIRVDFYTNDQQYLESWVLVAGDVLLLATGGHGFEVLEEVEMIEVKQGPYAGDQDKARFDGINSNQVLIAEEYK